MSVQLLAVKSIHSSESFDRRRMLPGIKSRYLNDVTCRGLWAALACTGQVAPERWKHLKEERRGLVVASTCADFFSRQEADALVRRQGVASLNSISAPNVSANIMAAHIAIHVQTHAFSHTLVSPGLGALEGVCIALQSLHAHETDAVLVVSAEPDVMVGVKQVQPDPHRDVPVSGSVAILLGRASDQIQSRPVIRKRFWGMCQANEHTPHALHTCWGRFLAEAGRKMAGQQEGGGVVVLCSEGQEREDAWVQRLEPYGFPGDRIRVQPVESNGSNGFLMGMTASMEKGTSLVIAAAGRRRMAFSLNG